MENNDLGREDGARSQGEPGSTSLRSPEPEVSARSGNDPSRVEVALRVMRLFDSFDGPSSDHLWWRTDSEYAPVTMIVNCNDLFIWACADCELVTAHNIASLEVTIAEVAAIDATAVEDAPLLWCCRQRRRRPQAPYYKHLDPKLHALFDACGPSVAQAIEARRAETAQTGSVEDESAVA